MAHSRRSVQAKPHVEIESQQVRWVEEPRAGSPVDYFAFVEEVKSVAPWRPYHGPANDEISLKGLLPSDPESNGRHWLISVRLSGIEQRTFFEMMDQFEPLPADGASREQRDRRKRDLRSHLGTVDLPIIHIVLEVGDAAWPWLRGAFSDVEWFDLSVRFGSMDGRTPLIFSAVPESDPEQSTSGNLMSVAMVGEPLLERLRDIFSLAHIPDADSLGETNSGQAPLPVPLLPETHAEKVIELEEDAEPAEEEAHVPIKYITTTHGEAD